MLFLVLSACCFRHNSLSLSFFGHKPFIVVSVLRNLVTFVLIHAKTVLLLILLNLKDKTPLGDQHEELHDLQMHVKSAYPKSSNLQTQNLELTVIWSEPQTVVDSLKQLLVILNLW